jgi:nitrogen regulatory protein P-II 1
VFAATATTIVSGVNDDFLDKAIEAINKGAQTGNEGDGVIFVVDLAQAMRIRTGEQGIL